MSHKDSKHAQYFNEQRENGVIVEEGELLDNKGTDRTDDDVYEAVVKQKGEHLYEFKIWVSILVRKATYLFMTMEQT
ncbi:MAG: hypothetical protein ACR5LB_10105 [Wolbachia sp.]